MNQFQLSARSDSFLFLGNGRMRLRGRSAARICVTSRHHAFSRPSNSVSAGHPSEEYRSRLSPGSLFRHFLKAEQSQSMSFTVENAVIALGDRAACLLDGETPETQQTLSTMWGVAPHPRLQLQLLESCAPSDLALHGVASTDHRRRSILEACGGAPPEAPRTPRVDLLRCRLHLSAR